MSLDEEFQVIVLAGGFGKHIAPLADKTPKALIPVANRPLLSYQLEMLESAKFSNVLIITRHSCEEQIRHYITKVYKGPLKIELATCEDYVGTAQALVRIKDKIKKDFIVISSDLIADGSFIHAMIDAHRLRDTAVTVLVKEKAPEDPSTPPIGKKKKKVFDFVGTSADSRRLVLLSSSEDFEDTFAMKRNILTKFPYIRLSTNVIDPHFYILAHWTLELMEKKKSASLKHDFIPFLLKLQYRQDLKAEYGIGPMPDSKMYENGNTGMLDRSSHSLARRTSRLTLERVEQPELFWVNSPVELTMSSTLADISDTIFCQAFTIDQKHYCIRANTLLNYMDANRDIATGTKCFLPYEPASKKSFISPNCTVGQTQIGPECIVSDGTSVGDKCSIKKSIIGKHCVIGDGVKIINSVVMDHVTIKAGSKIQNSIICNKVQILEHAEIVDSVVAPDCTVASAAHIKREIYHGDKDSDDDSM